MQIPLGLGYNEHPERFVSVENTLNMQPEASFGGRSPVILRSCPGLSQFSVGNTAATEGRGGVFVNNTLFVVLGKYLYSVDSGGTATQIGRVDGSGRCGMEATSDEVFIATGGTDYVYDIANGTLASESTSPNSRSLAMVNGRFVKPDPEATGPSAGRFYWSDVLDGTTWNALNFATAEQKPDRSIAVAGLGNTLLLFGEETMEPWRGDADGFVPITGAAQPFGIAGELALAQADGMVCFLSNDGSVRITNGSRPQRVSTPAVEAALAADSATECCAYKEEGHTVFEFSTATKTLCYDHAASQVMGKPVWFEKSTNDSRHKACWYVYGFGKTLAVADDDGKVYELTRSAYPDARQFTIPHLVDDANRQWSRLDLIELLCRTGSGAIPDNDPQVMLTISRDHGYTWGEERWVGLGTIGKYNTRARWRRLGRFLQMTLRFRLTDQVDWTVTGIHARGR